MPEFRLHIDFGDEGAMLVARVRMPDGEPVMIGMVPRASINADPTVEEDFIALMGKALNAIITREGDAKPTGYHIERHDRGRTD